MIISALAQFDFSEFESAPNVDFNLGEGGGTKGDKSGNNGKGTKKGRNGRNGTRFVWKRGLRPFTVYPDRKRLIEFSDDYKGDIEVILA